MTRSDLDTVPLRRRSRAVTSAIFLTLCAAAAPVAHAQSFDGPLVGVDVGRQHVIAGALVNDVDTLQEASRLVMSVYGGWRRQFRGVVIGGDVGLGRMDGQLRLEDGARGLVVDYAGDSQWHWALHLGHTLGTRAFLFAYVSEVTRTFDVSVAGPAATFTQRDEQGLLRFGVGFEHALTGPLRFRVTAGSSRADFGDRPTNITIARRFEGAAGLVWQF